VIVVSNASPLISLDRIGCLGLLPKLFDGIAISREVFEEVVVSGRDRPGAVSVSAAPWIAIHSLVDALALEEFDRNTGLGIGEVSAILLAKQLQAGLVLMDDLQGRRRARAEGFAVAGCVGVLELAYRRGLLEELPAAYCGLMRSGAYVPLRIIQASLKALGLPPL